MIFISIKLCQLKLTELKYQPISRYQKIQNSLLLLNGLGEILS